MDGALICGMVEHRTEVQEPPALLLGPLTLLTIARRDDMIDQDPIAKRVKARTAGR